MNVPAIDSDQIGLLERLCNVCAVSGDEAEVRKIVLEQVQPLADVKVDALGNVLAVKTGQGLARLRVMVAAHMDEVGFMLTNDEQDGIYRFDTVGGLDSRLLVGKPVWVGRNHLPGVIGAKPVHLTSADETRNAITTESLRIDVGPVNAGKVQIGDRATFATTFSRVGAGVRAKALDNRLGVATLIELLRRAPANLDLLAAFTVQEEVGLRGAKVAAYALDPQLAIVLDCTPANDLPAWDGSDNLRFNSRLGAGPVIYISDGSTLSDPRLVRFMIDTAEAEAIPYQLRQPGGGGTDAGAIHKQRAGVPSISISVPARYLHTPAAMARLEDWENTLRLVHAALARLTPDILAAEL